MEVTGLSSDVLRLFLIVVEQGSFSSAARRVGKSQPAVSYAIAGLERDLGVTMFDRSGRRPQLTETGTALLGDIRAAVRAVDGLQGRASGLASGVEARVSIAVDQLFDYAIVRTLLQTFQARWPEVALELRSESLGAVAELVRDGVSDLGVSNAMTASVEGLVRWPLTEVEMVAVCAPLHPLASVSGRIGATVLGAHTQLVITDRSRLTAGVSAGIVSSRTWSFVDLHTKHRCLLDGFGWGNMPRHLVRDDLERGALIALDVFPDPGRPPLLAMHRASSPPGPAGRWLLNALLQEVSAGT